MKPILIFALLALAAACETKPPPCADDPACVPTSPFSAADKATPVALDPNRPQPPPPTRYDVARDEERHP